MLNNFRLFLRQCKYYILEIEFCGNFCLSSHLIGLESNLCNLGSNSNLSAGFCFVCALYSLTWMLCVCWAHKHRVEIMWRFGYRLYSDICILFMVLFFSVFSLYFLSMDIALNCVLYFFSPQKV
jgi:hypothetical protein